MCLPIFSEGLYHHPHKFSATTYYFSLKIVNINRRRGTVVVGRQIQERSTIILSFWQTLHASYLLEDYQLDYRWYVYIFLLKVFSLLSLHISYILGPFGTTLLHAHFIHLSSTIFVSEQQIYYQSTMDY